MREQSIRRREGLTRMSARESDTRMSGKESDTETVSSNQRDSKLYRSENKTKTTNTFQSSGFFIESLEVTNMGILEKIVIWQIFKIILGRGLID